MGVIRLIPFGPVHKSSEEMRRYLILSLLGAWIFAGYVGTQIVSLLLSSTGFITSVPAIFVALVLGYAVYLDYSDLQKRGLGWSIGMKTLVIATVFFPPFVLAYLWKRGKELA